jgi:hypothetical protein
MTTNINGNSNYSNYDLPGIFPACQLYSSTQLSCEDPAAQYQTLKIIQNTVRVPSSLYTMNLAALNIYQKPSLIYRNVNWNQMSDRKEPHYQAATVPSRGSSTKSTITRHRPGASTPGGRGCDIKHNSYDRYLGRLKGKGPVRRGVIPPNFGDPIVFNPAFPVYGGKTTKTSIVNGCNCPIDAPSSDEKVYEANISPIDFSYDIVFNVGTYVYATNAEGYYVQALVIAKSEDGYEYTVKYNDGTTATKSSFDLLIYFPCSTTNACATSIYE